MKILSLCCLISLGSLGCFGSTALEPIATGNWSEPVNGLRGRLLFAEDPEVNGTRVGVVYVEPQNMANVMNAMEIFYDFDNTLSPEVVDSSGNPAQPPNIVPGYVATSIIAPIPYSYWFMLPQDSTLRFRVSVSGYGIPKDNGLAIGLLGGFWLISPNSKEDSYLRGTLTVKPPHDPEHIHAWQGVLKLPKLKIPAELKP